jgi:hypothetical protein
MSNPATDILIKRFTDKINQFNRYHFELGYSRIESLIKLFKVL